jgi:hypothetical protein
MFFGDWGLGIGDWGLGIGPNPQSPIPNPQSPKNMIIIFIIKLFFQNYELFHKYNYALNILNFHLLN